MKKKTDSSTKIIQNIFSVYLWSFSQNISTHSTQLFEFLSFLYSIYLRTRFSACWLYIKIISSLQFNMFKKEDHVAVEKRNTQRIQRLSDRCWLLYWCVRFHHVAFLFIHIGSCFSVFFPVGICWFDFCYVWKIRESGKKLLTSLIFHWLQHFWLIF